jgi:RNA polymerase sigma-70 factor (ECF subfamily)
VSVRDELVLLTPRLRRYARALTQASPAPNDIADELVHTTLMRLLDCGLPDRKSDLVLQVFALLTQLNRDSEQDRVAGFSRNAVGCATHHGEEVAHAGHRQAAPNGLCAALSGLTLEEREALLLVVLEGFSYAQAARILRISRSGLMVRLSRARGRLAETLGNNPAAVTSVRRVAHLRVVK